MFKAIYAIAKTIQEKDLYIYGINRDSVAVFTNLALWGADIKGFIDSGEERYVGQHYMNRPILSIEQIKDRIQEVTFVAADEHSKKQLEMCIRDSSPYTPSRKKIRKYYFHIILRIVRTLSGFVLHPP